MFVLSSCASTPQSRQIGTRFPDSLPLAVELTDTPFYPQTENYCGPATMATLLKFHGVETTPEELAKQIYIPERKGSLQIEMTVATRRHEMLPYKLEPELIDLFTEIAAGNPVLVLQNLSFNWYPKWHYAVVVGYDIKKREIILRSGTTRRWITPIKVFERTWQRADHWALVILPIGEIPKTAKPLNYLKTVHAFEELGHSALALKAYRSASKRWPNVADIWMTLGNMAYQKNNWPEAISAFSTASRLQPNSIVSWNNLAYALNANGCHLQAKTALRCGLEISPADENLLDSWQDLVVGHDNKDNVQCARVECN